MTMQQSDMERYNPLLLKEVMAQTPYQHKRQRERKFRYKFVLRCLINLVTTIKYFNELCHLNQPRALIVHRPLLPTKIQRPCLYTELAYVAGQELFWNTTSLFSPFRKIKLKKAACPGNKPCWLAGKEKTVLIKPSLSLILLSTL